MLRSSRPTPAASRRSSPRSGRRRRSPAPRKSIRDPRRRSPRRRSLRRRDAGQAQGAVSVGPRRAVHRGERRPAVLRQIDQLSGRSGACGDRGREGDRADPAGRSRGGHGHDRPHAGPLRSLSREAGRRHRLWFGRGARLAGGERGIEPHIPVIDKSQRKDGTFSREDFTYNRATDSYACPGGKELLPAAAPYRPSELRRRMTAPFAIAQPRQTASRVR